MPLVLSKASSMNKDTKIQIRIKSDTKKWLKEYAKDKNITISKIFVDFVEWLKQRESTKNEP